MFFNEFLNFHLPIPGSVVEFDHSSYTVYEDDSLVTFTIVKRTPTTLSITANFSTVPDSAEGIVTLLI